LRAEVVVVETSEAGSYLTADNQMTRKPNFAVNAEMKAVAERLTRPEIIDPRAAADWENHRVINHGGQQRAAGACEKCWEMLGAAAQRGLRRAMYSTAVWR